MATAGSQVGFNLPKKRPPDALRAAFRMDVYPADVSPAVDIGGGTAGGDEPVAGKGPEDYSARGDGPFGLSAHFQFEDLYRPAVLPCPCGTREGGDGLNVVRPQGADEDVRL